MFRVWMSRLSPVVIAGVTNSAIRDKQWDFRSDPKIPTRHHIFLIRHGQYTSSAQENEQVGHLPEQDFLQNDSYRVLTDTGVEQAKMTAARVADILQHEGLLESARVYSSDMARAKQTGSIIHDEIQKRLGKSVPLYVDPLLREGAPCTPKGYDGPWSASEAEYYEEGCRIETAFRKYFHRMDLIKGVPPRPYIQKKEVLHTVDILVCHGNLIRYCFLRALQLDPEQWLHFGAANGSITRLVIQNTGWVSCLGFGDAGAMPVSKVTFS